MIKLKAIMFVLLLSMTTTACGVEMNTEVNMEDAREVQKGKHTEVVTTVYENVEAAYLKQNDKNTVELSIDDQANTFKLSELKDPELIKTLKRGETIFITYELRTEKVADGEIKGVYLMEIRK
ncbi:hypothetical protein [Halalkalibacter lacteus]|uniref:hypothetical protein n=1 Tax=Halalkalibacter lacteus TaxID=3090663 RepID=UPI002FC8221F